MKQYDDKEGILFKYLLGELSEQEQEQIEENYFDDDEFFDRMLVVEDELIDAYVGHRLSISEQERFENHFLRSPDRRKRVELAKAWAGFFSRSPQSTHDKNSSSLSQPYPGFSRLKRAAFFIPLAAMFLLLIGLTWLFMQNGRLRRALEHSQAESAELQRKELDLERQIGEQRARNEELDQELADGRNVSNQLPPEKQLPKIASFVLTAGFTRGTGKVNSITIPKDSETVKLESYFRQGDYKNYRAVLRTSEGAEVWSQAKPRIQSKGPVKVMVLSLPAVLFNSGEYILTISGVSSSEENEIIDEYSFKVLRR
ncbi:MAG: hypothetical protein WBV94_00075 [Blastocatellia bacterium]